MRKDRDLKAGHRGEVEMVTLGPRRVLSETDIPASNQPLSISSRDSASDIFCAV